MKPPGPTERYWIVHSGAAGLAADSVAGSGVGAAATGAATGAGLGAGFSAGARGGAGGAAAFFSFSSPGLTGEGRDSRPRRCALPITALRLTPPNSSAIWLAVEPPVHIVFRRSIRSSVQDMKT